MDEGKKYASLKKNKKINVHSIIMREVCRFTLLCTRRNTTKKSILML